VGQSAKEMRVMNVARVSGHRQAVAGRSSRILAPLGFKASVPWVVA